MGHAVLARADASRSGGGRAIPRDGTAQVGRADRPRPAGAALDFGQYAHSNQPSHHVPFLYTWTDSPWKADHAVRSVLEQLYDSSPSGFCGDEDNAEMSSWYVLASLGLYQVCPARPEYRLTAPLFEEAIVDAEGGRRLRVLAPGSSTNARYAGPIRVDGGMIRAGW
ncbi:MAG: glycoside hydrolase domain-containing protein [Spirochaetota bacterium]